MLGGKTTRAQGGCDPRGPIQQWGCIRWGGKDGSGGLGGPIVPHPT